MEAYKVINEKPNIVFIKKNVIDEYYRINPESYDVDFLKKNDALNDNKLITLGEITSFVSHITGFETEKYVRYVDGGKYFIRIVNLNEFFIDMDNTKKIPDEAYYNLSKYHLKPGDILLSKDGTIGRAAIVNDGIKEAIGSSHVVTIRIDENKLDPYYLVTVINSKYGQFQCLRFSTGSIQKALNVEKIRKLQIPISSPEIQKYIGDKVREAEELREKAKRLKKEADEILNVEILDIHEQETIRNKGKWVNTQNVFIERLEPEYYEDRYLHAEQIIKKQKYETLGNIIEKIQDGPGGWSISTNDYVENGIPIVRGINIGNDGEFINSGFVYINTEKNKELKKTEVRPGQVLLTVRGTVGRATVMPNYIEKANLNAAVVKIKVKENIIDPYYLAGFFNSSIGRLQTSRIANGAIQLNMNLSECKTNLIPIPGMEIQQKYRTKFLESLDAKEQSKKLIKQAKQDVEDLIEGNFDMSKLN